MAGDVCDCCNKNPSVGVASSGLGAMSIAWCRACIDAGVEPWSMCVATLMMTGGSYEGLNEEAVAIIKRSVVYHGRTDEELFEEARKASEEFDRAMTTPPVDDTK